MIDAMARIVHTLLGLCLGGPLMACPILHVDTLDPGTGRNTAEPSVVVDGENFVLSWQARLDGGEAALRFRRFAVDGSSLGEGEIARGSGWFQVY